MYVDRLLVVDLEATCWQGPPPDGQYNEIIEVGNAMLNLTDGAITPGPELLVRPVVSKVSPFCTELTSITQEMVDERGSTLRDAIARLESFAGGNLTIVPWASYGDYDLLVLSEHCQRRGMDFPLSRSHTNVKRLVTMLSGWAKPVGMMKSLERLGITHEGTHHRGGDDATNIAKLYWSLCKDVRG